MSDNPEDLMVFIEEIRIIDCSRCANQEQYYGTDLDPAIERFRRLGWRREGNRVFCPACTGEL